MIDRNTSNTDKEFLERLAKFLAEVEPDNPEEIEGALREAGYDPSEITKQATALLDQLQSRSPYDWRNRSTGEIEAERKRLAAKAAVPEQHSRASLIDSIQHLIKMLGGEGAQLVTAHRNFERATDEDLASLLSELQYLADKKGRNAGSAIGE